MTGPNIAKHFATLAEKRLLFNAPIVMPIFAVRILQIGETRQLIHLLIIATIVGSRIRGLK